MKISVIIPVYNAEKYLPVCLESLLIQTFTDFEVLVVDDCSTDNSLAIAENYLEKFGGRLKIISLPENTGSGAVPRNVGLEFASGKYVFFIDSDDLIIDTALKTLYDYAEEYQAEVVYMGCGFVCDGETSTPKELAFLNWDTNSLEEEATLENENIADRVKNALELKFSWTPSKLVRRDFLISNDIKFPQIEVNEDVIWTFKLICLAERCLRISLPLCIIRKNMTSIMRKERTPEQMIEFRTKPLIIGLEYLNEFMREVEYFQKNPAVRFKVLSFFINNQLEDIVIALRYLKPTEAYNIFLREFSKAGSSQPALISYLLVMNNIYRNELLKK